MDQNTSLIQIKGLRDGVLITLGAGEWEMLENLLLSQIDEQIGFFKGARLALDVGGQVLRVAELSRLRDALSEREINLWALVSVEPKTVQTAQLLGLATRISVQRQAIAPPRAEKSEKDENTALWVARTLRSGTRLEYEGNIVIMGDVNPGAEIVAAGNVLVWGRLRGAVHAGAALHEGQASPNSSAFVCALVMEPARLQIADEIQNLAKALKSKKTVKISLKNGNFHLETWKGK